MVESAVAVDKDHSVDTAAEENIAASEDMASAALSNKVVAADHMVVEEELFGQELVVYCLLSSVNSCLLH